MSSGVGALPRRGRGFAALDTGVAETFADDVIAHEN
jgi:hypothetical protein